ncbi:unnamed protein product [Linum trigynum]
MRPTAKRNDDMYRALNQKSQRKRDDEIKEKESSSRSLASFSSSDSPEMVAARSVLALGFWGKGNGKSIGIEIWRSERREEKFGREGRSKGKTRGVGSEIGKEEKPLRIERNDWWL